MADTFQVVTSDFINVTITISHHNSQCIEKRFQKGITIAELKGKLELLTGGCSTTMKIEIYNKDDVLVCSLDSDDALLGSYPVNDGMRMHVIDKFVLQSEMDDLSKTEKFELSEEDYSKRTDTLKYYLERNRLGKYNEEEVRKREEEKKKEAEAEEAIAKSVKIGDRCEVRVPSQPVRRATIMFAGQVEFKGGWWIGVKYDEPLGKNDGSVNGKRYFECSPKYGGFVKPSNITVGDFPEETFDLDEM
ncbi:hypothetical protein R5R35_001505 [Gryllus longicercus]|uniref:CAP-Gly domain-containing protein n=1 Tax=Gryllus longicercus TaxID=2509291 RepID=A0AAN9ZJW4_9ORTH